MNKNVKMGIVLAVLLVVAVFAGKYALDQSRLHSEGLDIPPGAADTDAGPQGSGEEDLGGAGTDDQITTAPTLSGRAGDQITTAPTLSGRAGDQVTTPPARSDQLPPAA